MAPPAIRPLCLALAASVALAAPALAAPFDESTGTVSLEASALAWDLESLDSLPPHLVFTATGPDGVEMAADAVSPLFGTNAIAPMQGEKGLWLGKTLERVDLGFSEPEAQVGRRVEVSFWQRPMGLAASASLTWRLDGRFLGYVKFQPTGRRTDDGWFEVSSGPVDFAFGARFVPALSIKVDRIGAHGHGGYGGVSTDPNGLVLIDALEVADLGPATVPDARCAIPSEPADCGEQGLCYLGRCVDAAAISGRMPAEAIKGEYLDRRIFEVARFFGNRVLDTTRPAFLAKMEEARQATSALAFWRAVMTAYEAIGDAHGSPPYTSYSQRPGMGMCLHLGEADRLPEAAAWPARKLPLVFYADYAATPGKGLHRGDVLTTVDDLPVDLWMELAGTWIRHFGSPRARQVAVAPDVVAAAARTGARLGFSRCPASIANVRVCKAEELIKHEVDYYALFGAALWDHADVSGWRDDEFTCDFRFNRLNTDVPQGDYSHVASGDDGPVRILEANGVPGSYWSSAWGDAVASALTPTASLFVIDERTGYGGTDEGADNICAPFSDMVDPVVSETITALGEPMTDTLLSQLRDCYSQSQPWWRSSCSGYSVYTVGDFTTPGTLAGARAAVLTSMDVSGNDWLTRLQKARPGLSRIFGPSPTFGGFGYINVMPTYIGEMMGGSGQMSDTLLHAQSATTLTFESGPGVDPDEIVLQTQSDALAGKDTLYERAKAWLLQ